MTRLRTVITATTTVMLAATAAWTATNPRADASGAELQRLSTSNPYTLAADIARQIAGGDLTNLTHLIITTGEQPFDAIISAGLAGYLDTCPQPGGRPCNRTATLLTQPDTLTRATADAITTSRIPPSRITIIGGTNAVSDTVHAQIAAAAGWNAAGTNPVVRVSGATRYDTATTLATHITTLSQQPGGLALPASYRTIIIANGHHPADALAASTLAYRGQHLLLLSPSTTPDTTLATTPDTTLDRAIDTLDAHCALIIGGTNALSPELDTHLNTTLATTGTGNCTPQRIAGTDRHHTATLIATRLTTHGTPTTTLITNPHTQPLPLTAAPLTRTNTTLLYTTTNQLPPTTTNWLTQHPTINTITLIGTTTTITPQVATQTLDTTTTPPPPLTTADTTPTTTTTTVPPPPPSAFPNRAGGANNDFSNAVATLSDGSAVMTGEFRLTATFLGATTGSSLTSAGNSDVFVAKTNADGTWAWATRAGGASNDFSKSVATLSDGSAIVSGYFWGTATFPGATTGSSLSHVGDFDIYVAKIDPHGNWEWAASAGGTGDDRSFSVSALSDGSAIVAGHFTGTATFSATPTPVVLTSAGGTDFFVAKIDPNGNWLWAASAGGTGDETLPSVATTNAGAAVVAGTFSGSITVGATTTTSAGGTDIVVAKIDPNGNWLWATRAGGTDNDRAGGTESHTPFANPTNDNKAVATLNDGSTVVTGAFRGTAAFPGALSGSSLVSAGNTDIVVAKLDSHGNWLWATRAGSGGAGSDDGGAAIAALGDGSGAIVTGNFQSAATFVTTTGSVVLNAVGSSDLFVSKINADGTWAWVTQAGGTGSVVSRGVSTLSGGRAVITGDFTLTITFGSSATTSAGNRDIFVARVTASGQFG